MWKPLSKCKDNSLFRGDRLRVQVKPKDGEDEVIDFMIFHALGSSFDGFSLIRISGYKAGHFVVTFPEESKPPDASGLSVEWLKQNAKKWLPVDGKVLSVWVGNAPPRVRRWPT
jgi:hypothetical protein